MKKKFKKTKIILFIFLYLLFLLFLRGKVLEKSREIYKKEKEILELYYRATNTKIELLKTLLGQPEEERKYVER
ncbi:MAG: hypothetical protein ABDH37_01555 [Candidatus Hydrothermales bacterium]